MLKQLKLLIVLQIYQLDIPLFNLSLMGTIIIMIKVVLEVVDVLGTLDALKQLVAPHFLLL